MKPYVAFSVLLLGYLLVILPFTDYMMERPVSVKLGYSPNAQILKMTASDYRFLLAESNVVRVLFYFGSIVENLVDENADKPEYDRMYGQMVQSAKLDPYNQDIYYFSQAMFTWNVGRVFEVNKLLEYGMEYRISDWQLPYWAGFNAAYFLNDYETAARYFQRAAELSGSGLFTTLAARYFHESGQSELGILFLDTMIKSAKNDSLRTVYLLRKEALEGSLKLQKAVESYRRIHHAWPRDLHLLVSEGFLSELPEDPYGGTFFLTAEGTIETTSHFAFKTDSSKNRNGAKSQGSAKGDQ